MVLNKSLQVGITWSCTANWSIQLIRQQEINVQNMNVELVAQMFKNYQSNVLFHLEGRSIGPAIVVVSTTHKASLLTTMMTATDSLKEPA
jgi:hypothetical protein